MDNQLQSQCAAPAAVRSATYHAVMHVVGEERELLLALAHALEGRLRPADPRNPRDDDRVTEWRLAELLAERLGSLAPERTIGALLFGSERAYQSALAIEGEHRV